LHDFISGEPVRVEAGAIPRQRQQYDRILRLGQELHHATRGARKKQLRLDILRARLDFTESVLSAEAKELSAADSKLAAVLFGGISASDAEKRRRLAKEIAELKSAIEKIQKDRKELDKLERKVADADFYPRLRRLEGADFDSPFNFAWRIDFANIFAPRETKPVATMNGQFPFVNQVAGQKYIMAPRRELGGFDIIVGNPPFVTPRNAARRLLYHKRWQRVTTKNYQLVCPFFELAFGVLLRGAGELGFIVSNAFGKRDFGRPLVEDFFPTVHLQKVVDCSGLMFPGHGTPTCIIFGSNNPPDIKAPIRVAAILPGGGDLRTSPEESRLWQTLASHHDDESFEDERISVAGYKRTTMSKWPWTLGSPSDDVFATYHVKIGTLCDEPIGAQFITGRDEIYVVSSSMARRVGLPIPHLRPYSTGEDVRNWCVEPQAYIVFPYDDRLRALKTPLAAPLNGYLAPFRKPLEDSVVSGSIRKAETSLKWYEFRRLATILFT
jgi:hypothetical protein